MAAPKKRKSLTKRRIAQGNKIRSNIKGFTGFNLSQKIFVCKNCNNKFLQSFHCKCVI